MAIPSATSAISDPLLRVQLETTQNFLVAQEAKLKLRDWLLTILQRCPRYAAVEGYY